MTFDEALEILEMSPRENPEAARRAYLLQLQRNGPEVPPDLYERFTAAYDLLKNADIWPSVAPEEDSLADLKREAAARRARRGGRSDSAGEGRIIDPGRVPQRNESNAATRIIDPVRVPQRSSRRAQDDEEAPRIRRSLSDARQAASTVVTPAEPEPPRAPAAEPPPEPPRAPVAQQASEPPQAPAAKRPREAMPDTRGAPIAPSGLEPPPPAAPATPPRSATGDPFADLLADDAAPVAARPAVDLTLGGELEFHGEPESTPAMPDAQPPAPKASPAEPRFEATVNPDPLMAEAQVPRARETPTAAPRRPRGRPGAKAKPKALDDASLAIFSKVARTYTGLIDFANLVKTLESTPNDAIGLRAQELFDSGERVAATGLLVAGFECMEGQPTRRWIDIKACLEMLLKLSELASEDHTAHECCQSVRRAMNRWRTETEDPRIVFQEATLQRWSWLNELTQLPHELPHEIRSELVHAIRAGDLEEAVLPLSTYASRHEEEMARLKPIFAQTAPKLWSTLEPMLRAKPKRKEERRDKDGARQDDTKPARRRRRRAQGAGASRGLPAWAWGLVLVCLVGGVFAMVASLAVQDETEDSDFQVAADALCKVVGGNKPACHEARRVVRALREGDCETLAGGLIQDFSKEVAAAQQLRGALDTGSRDGGHLASHEDTLIDGFYAVCDSEKSP